ncbi:NB-ARC domain-containing protein [Curtobacterium sp. MCBA15_004]|nr:NB-ARC domain-containing protein [Curtobacterium sp. MCBA15_004]WIA97033.1 NB-ARC domain-containing protein [Curtobacterium sp. MCBA15_004]
MSTFNASRLTCFAIVSAMETDGRDLILHLDEHGTPASWPKVAEENAQGRFARDNGSRTPSRTDLVQYLDFPDVSQILFKNKAIAQQLVSSEVLDLLKEQSERLIAIRNRVAHNRPLEIEDLPTLSDICQKLANVRGSRWVATADTWKHLQEDPSYVLGLTIQLRTDPVEEPFHNLPVPDFDETGFMGRGSALRQITKHVLGPWPAVSILGDGGIGKTSIALKVAYDILDNHTDEFDAVVWVTAKSSTLTTHEVQRINGAILDSVGLFAEAAKQLGGNSAAADPVAELLDYLEAFKVLLILDNMETVMDQRLRDFLRDLPRGSKVLITSRIGFQMENPVKLDPLTDGESRQLLMALAHGRNVPVLKNLDAEGLDKLVGKLRGHPLYIKWLVAGVQFGKRPSEIVANDDALLDYCMSNVYDKLSIDSRQVLQSMQVMRGSRMQAELAYLNEFSARQIQTALLELLATNFVSMTRSAIDKLESAYAVGDFASAYLARKKPTDQGMRRLVLDRAERLGELGSRMTGEQRLNRYEARTLDIRGPQDVPTARILRDALKSADQGRLDHAVSLCHEAQKFSPSYHESWRIEGFVQSLRHDDGLAEAAYERAVEAVESGPSEALVCYHFGTYILDQSGQAERALELFRRAARTEPTPDVLLGISRAHLQLTNYADTVTTCRSIVEKALTKAQFEDVALLAFRAVSYGLIRELWNGRVGSAVELAELATDFAYALPVEQYSTELVDWLLSAAHWTSHVVNAAQSDDYLSRRAGEFQTKLEQRVRIVDPQLLERGIASVKLPRPESDFIFLNDIKESRFAHRNDFLSRNQWHRVADESILAFDRVSGAKGPRAARVRLLD